MSELINCPEIVGNTTCGLPAEVKDTRTFEGVNGPVTMIRSLCIVGHCLLAPSDYFEAVSQEE